MTKLCECGCGEPAPIATYTIAKRGYFKGQSLRFVSGHNGRRTPNDYVVDENGCWVWQRSMVKGGYGRLGRNGRKLMLAHRWYWEQANGPVPGGMDLDHLCRNRACVNPEHLDPVTRVQNVRRGVKPKLTMDRAEAIRSSSLSNVKLAEIYGVSASTVQAARSGKTWRHGGAEDQPGGCRAAIAAGQS